MHRRRVDPRTTGHGAGRIEENRCVARAAVPLVGIARGAQARACAADDAANAHRVARPGPGRAPYVDYPGERRYGLAGRVPAVPLSAMPPMATR